MAPAHDPDATNGPFDPRLFAKLVYLCVRQVPRGKVATYGQVARLCHHPRHARHVGKALRALPEGTDVPWQRIVNAAFTISPRGDGGGAARQQAARLREEGVAATHDAMGTWKVPVSAHWDAGGAQTLEEVLAAAGRGNRRGRGDGGEHQQDGRGGGGERGKNKKKRRRVENGEGVETEAAAVMVKDEVA